MDRRPIGIFDSGVGGLTVVKELIGCLPGEDIIYFGDTARVPYGTKSKQTIIRFSIENILLLLRYNVKLIIVACNTSSSVALPALRRNFRIPIIGVIEPGADDALLATTTGRIAVIGTSATIRSRSYEKEIIENASRLKKAGGRSPKSIKIFSKGCPLFVPLVEEGWLNKRLTLDVIKEYLSPLKQKRPDVLILGCTHYPLLKNSIRRVMGSKVRLIDSAISAAREAKRFLSERGLLSGRSKARLKFLVSDEPERFKKIGERFLGKRLADVRRLINGL